MTEQLPPQKRDERKRRITRIIMADRCVTQYTTPIDEIADKILKEIDEK